MLISIDPGKKAAGVALFENNALCFAFLAQGELWEETAQQAIRTIKEFAPVQVFLELVIEEMQVYADRKVPSKDLIELSQQAGYFIGALRPNVAVSLYTPAAWKGQTPKDVMNKRIMNKLTPEELACIHWPLAQSLRHNVKDAIGIGMHHIGRIEP